MILFYGKNMLQDWEIVLCTNALDSQDFSNETNLCWEHW